MVRSLRSSGVLAVVTVLVAAWYVLSGPGQSAPDTPAARPAAATNPGSSAVDVPVELPAEQVPKAELAAAQTDHRARSAARSARQVHLQRYDSPTQWSTGSSRGTSVTSSGRLSFGTKVGHTTSSKRRYDVAKWTSGWVAPGFSFTELIPSWSATTPGDSWIEIRVRGRSSTQRTSSWDVMARWAATERHFTRRSLPAQRDDLGRVNVDTWVTAGLTSYQLQIRLVRRSGTTARPSLDLATVMTSRLPSSAGVTSLPGVARGVTLDVPAYSQMSHVGHSPQWGGGGEAWCSPTSTAMVLGYYRRLPSAAAYAWVGARHTDPWVDNTARRSYDFRYRGTGNWSFSTAYAARAGKAFVTRLRDLTEAEQLVKAGIPPVVSLAWRKGELPGAAIATSAGHLLVIVGFTASGDVVVNDPAATRRSTVRRTYPRAQFERAWLNASGGMAYVIHDAAHPLPAARGNW